ncbi:MAG: rRNA pseudouridine synthase [Clostridiales Family XIII bacterium]|jgi:23S rRNA pseudouridine2605 synthase|nr:rRNA pseudouridine synthase [Clostridiales Family XIII bacterium]
MRLNKFIAQAGVASRRKADELTANGNVKVNGAVVREMGYDVKEGDLVEVNGRMLGLPEKPVYIALNKPKGAITSVGDDKGRPTVMDMVADVPERIYPVGRLDYDTSGLLIMTNDGDLAQKLAHPGHKIYKTYRAKVAGVLSPERLAKLKKGVDIGGYVTAPAVVKLIKQSDRFALAEISIQEGKNRQVRKMFLSVGNKVLDLERVAIGDVYLGHLKAGHYRKLTRQEVEGLKGRL